MESRAKGVGECGRRAHSCSRKEVALNVNLQRLPLVFEDSVDYV